jgi:hypothetical protein
MCSIDSVSGDRNGFVPGVAKQAFKSGADVFLVVYN